MIYKMSRDLDGMLTARKFPLHVEFGPERASRDAAYDVIVVERDLAASDGFDITHGSNPNPRRSSSRYLASTATIYARSEIPGARPNDHEDLCEQYLDAFLISLYEWAKQALGIDTGLQITDGRYAPIDPLQETWTGAKYVLKFRIGRGVSKRDFNGLGRPTGAAAGVINTPEVT